LPQPDLSALAAYVGNLHQPGKVDHVSPASLQRGNQLFLQNCAPCHGASGDGKGTAANALLPEPANFKLKQPDFKYVLQVVSDGIAGTGMPSWKAQISDQDRKALADYVRSLFVPADSSEH
jgi:mono/diheme cytochrome c family protein